MQARANEVATGITIVRSFTGLDMVRLGVHRAVAETTSLYGGLASMFPDFSCLVNTTTWLLTVRATRVAVETEAESVTGSGPGFFRTGSVEGGVVVPLHILGHSLFKVHV